MTTSKEQEVEFRRQSGLKHAIASAINQWSAENGSDTPDFILANYLLDCLRAFDLAVHQRSHWYGAHQCIGGPKPVNAGETPP